MDYCVGPLGLPVDGRHLGHAAHVPSSRRGGSGGPYADGALRVVWRRIRGNLFLILAPGLFDGRKRDSVTGGARANRLGAKLLCESSHEEALARA